MPRPRVHDLDAVLDAVEAVAVESGPEAVTVRAISRLTSMSNGAIYHAFESRAGLVGRTWLRAAQRFLALQRDAIDAATDDAGARESGARDTEARGRYADERSRAVEAVVAAADSPARFLAAHPTSGKFLLRVSRDDVRGTRDLPSDLAEAIAGIDEQLVAVLIGLSEEMWDRRDRAAVDVIRDCVVELPTALLLRGHRAPDDRVRERLATAVRAVLTLPPPEQEPPMTNRTLTPTTKGHP
ncbi:TetR/AcrR family transcriptional regulator [Gordonia terrae]|uniref:TetR/AcrR family transcriptional regulator n=1 Tax=Gordonia terrae TaxID=2055 RepID=UPI003F6ACAC5